MFLSEAALKYSVNELRRATHPFIGITFLACKRARLPVGSQIDLSLDSITRDHLDTHHKIDPSSEFYFQPFKSKQFWVNPKYPSSGLQAINTQTFSKAFLHDRGTRSWGFSSDYLQDISSRLDSDPSVDRRCPIEAIAVWLGKSDSWPADTTIEAVVSKFKLDYQLTEDESESLFIRDELRASKWPPNLLQAEPADLSSVGRQFALPPDSTEELDGTLCSLELVGFGPAKRFSLEFGQRLTVFVGDNGLGKSFLLDASWRALAGSWSGHTPWVSFSADNLDATLRFNVRNQYNQESQYEITYSPSEQQWLSDDFPDPLPVLCIYSKADGSFAVSDKSRSGRPGRESHIDTFSVEEVWHGQPRRIEGMIRDWLAWQSKDASDEFLTLLHVLRHLAPEDLGKIEPSETTRLPDDIKDIPTVQTSYGTVPITLLSAGVRRALQLAYMVIWTWYEHKRNCSAHGRPVFEKLVLIVDEIEAHLHPKWQRIVLPALLGVGKILSEDLKVQVITATHSPMVMASLETEFNVGADALYHLDLVDGAVDLTPLEFLKYGDASSWLMSPVFGLGYARSKAAERAIENAKSLQLAQEPNSDEVLLAHKELKRVLGGDDAFWPRWVFFARQHGLVE